MRSFSRYLLIAMFAGSAELPAALAQAPPAPTPPAGAPAAPAITPQKLNDPPVVSILRLPADNPFGANVETPALAPPKPIFTESVVTASFFGAMRVDKAGRVSQSRRVRDPIPSLAQDTKKSLDRWAFEPARKGGQPVETWASARIDLAIEVRPPKVEQLTLTPITPASPIPAPFDWGTDNGWYESLTVTPLSDGTVAVEQVDIPPNPKKYPWYADSHRGPFSCRLWVKVGASGKIEKVIPIQVSDPVLIAYLRQQLPNWPIRPARIKGQPAETWNELTLAGTVGYSIEVKQAVTLRKTLTGE
jgi:hypothetical protein